MNHSGSRILIPFSKGVVLSRIACLLFVITFNSHLSISIALHYSFAIASTFVDNCIPTCTSVNSYASTSMTFSSLVSFYVVCSSTKCYSIVSSFSDFSMNTKYINVAPSPICSFTHQLLLLLRKNSTINLTILYIL